MDGEVVSGTWYKSLYEMCIKHKLIEKSVFCYINDLFYSTKFWHKWDIFTKFSKKLEPKLAQIQGLYKKKLQTKSILVSFSSAYPGVVDIGMHSGSHNPHHSSHQGAQHHSSSQYNYQNPWEEINKQKWFYQAQIYKGDPRTCAIFIPAWGSNWGSLARGGYSNYFLTGCAARGLKPLPISKDFSPSKNGWFKAFFRNFRKSGPISKGFSTSKWLILQFFRDFCEMGPYSKDFFEQNGTHV